MRFNARRCWDRTVTRDSWHPRKNMLVSGTLVAFMTKCESVVILAKSPDFRAFMPPNSTVRNRLAIRSEGDMFSGAASNGPAFDSRSPCAWMETHELIG